MMICAFCKHSRVPFAMHPILYNLKITHRIHNNNISHRQYNIPPHHQHHHRFISASSQSSQHTSNEKTPQPSTTPHIPVLLNEVLSFFEGRDIHVYVDGTLGAGGHARAVIDSCKPHIMVGFDMDPTAHALASAKIGNSIGSNNVIPVAVTSNSGTLQYNNNSSSDGSTTAYLVRSNFSALENVLKQLTMTDQSPSSSSLFGHVDALLLDLGVSSMQLDTDDRGFSFLRDGPLDMRMDPGAPISAEDIVNTWPEIEIGFILKELGEERYWKSIARKIASARIETPIKTTKQLASIIGRPGGGGGDGKHPATRTFQALRIATNNELYSVAAAVPAAIESLAPGGRLAVITFHSLEDRIVKWAFRKAAGMSVGSDGSTNDIGTLSMNRLISSGGSKYNGSNNDSRSNKAGRRRMMVGSMDSMMTEGERGEATVKILTKKPIVPTDEEVEMNTRSRSAKLRVVEKL